MTNKPAPLGRRILAALIDMIMIVTIVQFLLILISQSPLGNPTRDFITLQNSYLAEFGLEHTGMLGDVIIGTFLDGINDEVEMKPRKVISSRFLDKIDAESYLCFKENFSKYSIYYNNAFSAGIRRTR